MSKIIELVEEIKIKIFYEYTTEIKYLMIAPTNYKELPNPLKELHLRVDGVNYTGKELEIITSDTEFEEGKHVLEWAREFPSILNKALEESIIFTYDDKYYKQTNAAIKILIQQGQIKDLTGDDNLSHFFPHYKYPLEKKYINTEPNEIRNNISELIEESPVHGEYIFLYKISENKFKFNLKNEVAIKRHKGLKVVNDNEVYYSDLKLDLEQRQIDILILLIKYKQNGIGPDMINDDRNTSKIKDPVTNARSNISKLNRKLQKQTDAKISIIRDEKNDRYFLKL